MAQQISKEILTRERNARSLTAALEQQGPRIAQRLADELDTPVDDPAATFLPTTQALAHSLTAALTHLVTADDQVAHELAKIQDLRQTRDQAAQHLRQCIVRLRRMLLGHYVSPNLERLGIAEHTARSPFTLLRQADRLTQAARAEGLTEILGPAFLTAPADFPTLFLDLAPTAHTLRTTLRAIDEAQRDLDTAREERRRNLATFDRLYLHTARTLESFCHLANEPELADRVRPSEPRPTPMESTTTTVAPPPIQESAKGAQISQPGVSPAPPLASPHSKISRWTLPTKAEGKVCPSTPSLPRSRQDACAPSDGIASGVCIALTAPFRRPHGIWRPTAPHHLR